MKDYYYVLGIANDASKDEIKTAHRKLSMKFHPDQNSGDKFFEERFKDIQEAYETLNDDARRNIYDEQLKASGNRPSSEKKEAANSQNAQQATPDTSPITPIRKKNKLRQTLYGFVALIAFSSPAWLPPLVHKLDEEEKAANTKKDEGTSVPKQDSSNNKVILLKMIYDSSETSSAEDSAHTATTTADAETDDDGLTAQDVINRFFAAFSNKDCHAAWNLTYVTDWVRRGEDWFCSSNAFGTTTGVMVYEINPIETTNTHASFYTDYYSEDSYNGNKCYKQTIFLQKLEYTDNKRQWKITAMRNNTPPADCD